MSGNVTDQNQAIVVGAAVTAKNESNEYQPEHSNK